MRYFLVFLFVSSLAHADPILWGNIGNTTISGQSNMSSQSYSIEEDIPTKYCVIETGFLNEGRVSTTLAGASRAGIVIKGKFISKITDNLDTFSTIGVYISDSTVYVVGSPYRFDSYQPSLIGGLGLQYKTTDHTYIQLRWEHTQFNSKEMLFNSDILMIGVGYSQ
jgi:hypothetical protein